ncbi:MAG: hypothetical protein DMG13_19490 [Acidobacteria bacterium]|nr:MAG: hypothetical protein DMG13_19490 [Acidobacteriota bacterium]
MAIDRVNVTKRGTRRSQTDQANGLARTSEKEPRTAAPSRMKELDRLSTQIAQSRTERLNEVRQKLESGTYRVSAKAVARKLIESNRK